MPPSLPADWPKVGPPPKAPLPPKPPVPLLPKVLGVGAPNEMLGGWLGRRDEPESLEEWTAPFAGDEPLGVSDEPFGAKEGTPAEVGKATGRPPDLGASPPDEKEDTSKVGMEEDTGAAAECEGGAEDRGGGADEKGELPLPNPPAGTDDAGPLPAWSPLDDRSADENPPSGARLVSRDRSAVPAGACPCP